MGGDGAGDEISMTSLANGLASLREESESDETKASVVSTVAIVRPSPRAMLSPLNSGDGDGKDEDSAKKLLRISRIPLERKSSSGEAWSPVLVGKPEVVAQEGTTQSSSDSDDDGRGSMKFLVC